MRNEESIAAQRQRQVHVRLFGHHVALENPIKEVLGGFRMPDQHAGIQQIGDFECVRLNRQRRVDATAGDDHLDRQACAGPHRKVFHRAHRARSCCRREHARATECGPGALRHDGKFALATEVVTDVALGKQFSDECGCFALRCDRIRNHDVAAGPPKRFLDDLAACKERRRAWRFVHHLPGIGKGLPFFIFCPDD